MQWAATQTSGTACDAFAGKQLQATRSTLHRTGAHSHRKRKGEDGALPARALLPQMITRFHRWSASPPCCARGAAHRERRAPLGDAERERERPLYARRRSPACCSPASPPPPSLPPPARSAAAAAAMAPAPPGAGRPAAGDAPGRGPAARSSHGWRSMSAAVARRSGSYTSMGSMKSASAAACGRARGRHRSSEREAHYSSERDAHCDATCPALEDKEQAEKQKMRRCAAEHWPTHAGRATRVSDHQACQGRRTAQVCKKLSSRPAAKLPRLSPRFSPRWANTAHR